VADALGISEKIIGLTIVAAGTSCLNWLHRWWPPPKKHDIAMATSLAPTFQHPANLSVVFLINPISTTTFNTDCTSL
jgi:hypothetical protein